MNSIKDRPPTNVESFVWGTVYGVLFGMFAGWALTAYFVVGRMP
jgi:hypothetical protein